MASLTPEEARAMFERYNAMIAKAEEKAKEKAHERRPSLPSECGELDDCERWREHIFGEIAGKVEEIYDESLGEQRLLELNDEINKLAREKLQWELRIIELGGPDYPKYSGEKANTTRYFGAARKLPCVRELLPPEPVKNAITG